MKLTEGVIPHTLEWEGCRIGKLTASHINKIFINGQGKDKLIGVGGMTYINQKIGEILTQIMFDNVPETDDVQRGLAGEFFALERYTEITGITVYDSRLFQYNTICAGTTDGQTSNDGINVYGIVESKCPRAHKHIQILAVDAPIELKAIDPQYYNQVQANMMFAEAEQGDFLSYNEDIKHYDLQLRIIRLYPDMDWRKEFVERIDWVADYMAEQLNKILKAPERNLAYRIEQKPEAIEKLKEAIENIQNIKI